MLESKIILLRNFHRDDTKLNPTTVLNH